MKRIALVLLSLLFATAAVAQGNYAIRAGDTLRVEVLEDPNLNRNVLVLPDGNISFPFAGTLRAGGQTVNQVRRSITAGIAANFASEPNVYVSVINIPVRTSAAKVEAAAPVIDVYVMGEVNGPGLKEVAPGTTLLQFLAQSGGFTKFAATKRLQLRRRDPQTGREAIYQINYKALSRGASMANDIILAEGDVIIVPERRLFE
ncbi:polysaccharide biosynthesis/export family protein [Actibacterium lipolyticum]|uniref:Polysialic acid transport protein KpsD n=1 Tax=Actibacterium lipolyticum TaxID=1524263 RepID=A0A238KUS0_9RHOB|nr:polysaccharide biosynthesis/export family protein [Actibacterium lipolyticum]SMX46447.1 Polysialic acid transport protein KpsD precursor [Actibacterium lipolyticum]